uniref:Transposase Tc1-like domain-containing protein n=1 Tax=Cyprinus carpio TaxID=7962 RepID=A0A8C1LD44_CYPCA
MLQGGMTQCEVAYAVGTSQSVISRAWNRFRMSVTTPNQDRYLTLHARRNRFMPAVMSTQTVRRRLHEVGLRARRPAVRVPLSRAHKLARLHAITSCFVELKKLFFFFYVLGPASSSANSHKVTTVQYPEHLHYDHCAGSLRHSKGTTLLPYRQ